MQFTKAHGLGNDFILIDAFTTENIQVEDWGGSAKKACDRNFGIGADGLVIIEKSDVADLKMRIFNSDGTEPEMCGNAIRCVAGYVYQHKLITKKKITVETKAGILVPEIIESSNRNHYVKVEMGEPILEPIKIPVNLDQDLTKVVNYPLEVNGNIIHITCVSMGNPHCVVFVSVITDELITSLGPILEKHPIFPNKTNVEFVEVIDSEHLKMRVWERGAGPTLACGTGACAALVAAKLNNVATNKAVIHLAGGDLEIEWADSNKIYMTGPAVEVFTGDFPNET
ncbi:MAG: diaminopimelate epimerase [Bacillota bacterium]|nr:diaminopimelate epimerase [Bacillota bacterium]